MSEELNFEFNDYVIAIDEPYENDCGYVVIGKKQSNSINIVFKSPNKGTVNWFIELQKYITDLQSQLDQANERLKKETEERQHLQCDYKTLLSHYNNLKEIAIARPKFEHFEEYWYIENNPYCDNELQVFNGKVMEIICAYDEDWLYEYRFDTSCRYIEENMIFTTRAEAQAKLQELRGGE